jgi:hypothetical protein
LLRARHIFEREPADFPHAPSEFLRLVPAHGIAVLRIMAAETEAIEYCVADLQPTTDVMIRAARAADRGCVARAVMPQTAFAAKIAWGFNSGELCQHIVISAMRATE